MRDENAGAFIFVDRFDELGATVDVEMVGRLVEDEELRPVEGGEAHQQARLLAAGQSLDLRIGARAGKADHRRAAADLRLRLAAHALRDVSIGRSARLELVDLMLGEIADLKPVGAKSSCPPSA